MGWLEEWRLKLSLAKVEVEVEAELGNILLKFVATDSLDRHIIHEFINSYKYRKLQQI